MSNITNDWIAWKSTASMRKGRTIGKVIDQNCLQRRRAIHLGRLVDVVGNGAQPGQANQHDVGRPHPGVDQHDRPRRQGDASDHRERTRRNAGEKADQVVERPDLRLEQQGPEVAHDRRGQHHRQQDDGRPEAVAAEFLVDEQRQSEADQDLQRDRPEDEMRRDLEVRPQVLIGENIDIIVDADECGRRGQVGHEAGE